LSSQWWTDPAVQKEIGLSPEKSKRIDEIYKRRANELAPIAEEWSRQLAELDKMTRARTVDETTYGLQVMRVEALRSRLSESRTMLLYRMYRELQPEQHRKLQEIIDRRAEMFGRGGRSTSSGR
jgi:Spy/CpxP family protein refolding chaperone